MSLGATSFVNGLLCPMLLAAGSKGPPTKPPDIARSDTLEAPLSTEQRRRAHSLVQKDAHKATQELSPVIILMVQHLDRDRLYRVQMLLFALAALLEDPLNDVIPWIDECERMETIQNKQLNRLSRELNSEVRAKQLSLEEQQTITNNVQGDQRRLYRASRVIRSLDRWMKDAQNSEQNVRIRKALTFLCSIPEFGSKISLPERDARPVTDFELLQELNPYFTDEDRRIFQRAGWGRIRNRTIAFDIDATLADARFRPVAMDELAKAPDKYEVAKQDLIYQFRTIRLPYRGIQALLLGLAAAGNRLALLTVAKNLPGNLESFLNDFPLLKLALDLVPRDDPFRLLTVEELDASPRIHSGLSRKYPTKECFFHVLVDDEEQYADDMERMGLGRRWVAPGPTAMETLQRLEDYFA